MVLPAFGDSNRFVGRHARLPGQGIILQGFERRLARPVQFVDVRNDDVADCLFGTFDRAKIGNVLLIVRRLNRTPGEPGRRRFHRFLRDDLGRDVARSMGDNALDLRWQLSFYRSIFCQIRERAG
jgi:hypothetical protein